MLVTNWLVYGSVTLSIDNTFKEMFIYFAAFFQYNALTNILASVHCADIYLPNFVTLIKTCSTHDALFHLLLFFWEQISAIK